MTEPAYGSRHEMHYVKESTPGITPSNPAMTPVRHNSTTLGIAKETLQSEELRADRQVADLRHSAIQAEGDIVGELSYETFDDFLAAVLGGDWQADTPSVGESTLKAGTNRTSFTFQRHFTDKGLYQIARGIELNTWSLSVSPSAIVQTTFGTIGRAVDPITSTEISGATYGSPTSSKPMDAFSGTIQEDGSDIAAVTELSLSLENGLEPQHVVGSKEAGAIGIGRSNLTGEMTVFFYDEVLANKFINEVESSLKFVLQDGSNQYEITLPRIKYTGGKPDVGGPGSVNLTLAFQALVNSEADPTQITIVKGPVS